MTVEELAERFSKRELMDMVAGIAQEFAEDSQHRLAFGKRSSLFIYNSDQLALIYSLLYTERYRED